jgi:hypothetical protein
VVGERRGVDAGAIAHRTAGVSVPAFAETLQDFVAAPIPQGLCDQQHLLLRQRVADGLHRTFERNRFKLNRSRPFSIGGAALSQGR